MPDFAALAARATSRAGSESALELLNLPHLQVFPALQRLHEQAPDCHGLAATASTLPGATPFTVADLLAELGELAFL
ncbi:hypothetical protein AOC05_01530 [Arthrobacter alpinus]|uniref:Uncharacterized protein n=1 Tax=Arthrobacter alpinus TaxID=656366 RepID=A0A0M5LX70_9MICC|nr:MULTISPECIES: hypothetical protein [Arthrobacter]ALE91337.1 hypothetical protein AOC05_01530 [Arthrobacter alpinus]